MGRNYLNKINILLFLCFILFFTNVIARESYSSLYIKITDTTTAIRNNNQNEAKKLFSEVRDEFKKVKNADSVKGKKVQELLNKEKSTLSEEDLREVTTALLAFEKEQNPVNDNEEKKKFQSRMNPALDVLEKAIQSKDVELMKKEYLKFNGVWTRNESFIRSRSIAYYGKVETAMSFLRSSMEVEPFDYDNTINSFNDLK